MPGKTKTCALGKITQGFMECVLQCSFSSDFIKKNIFSELLKFEKELIMIKYFNSRLKIVEFDKKKGLIWVWFWKCLMLIKVSIWKNDWFYY